MGMRMYGYVGAALEESMDRNLDNYELEQKDKAMMLVRFLGQSVAAIDGFCRSDK